MDNPSVYVNDLDYPIKNDDRNVKEMKVWYKAVCDKHKEFVDVMVDAPARTMAYLGDHNQAIYDWLQEHYGCELWLCWRDDQMDKLWDNEYTETVLK